MAINNPTICCVNSSSVLEVDAATYLYNFPTTKLQDPQVGGVFLAAPLDAVVDNQVRNYIQKVIGAKVAGLTLAEIIAQKSAIVTEAETASIGAFKKQGIAISYIGLGGPLEFDPEVQAVINKLYVAQRNIEVANLEATKVSIDANAAAEAAKIRADADAIALKKLSDAVGGDAEKLAGALESYRWNGSRVTVLLSPDSSTAISIPQPTLRPTNVPVQP